MVLRTFGTVALAVSVIGLVAVDCGYPTKSAAAIPIQADTLTAYSIDQAPQPQSPSAFDLATPGLVVPDGTLNFDFAFLLMPTGKVVIYQAKLIGTVLGSPRVVGWINMPKSFDAITIAPHTGYQFNIPDTISVGVPFVIISQNPSFCAQISITSQQALYGKFIVDSVKVPTGEIFFRSVVDDNCDYDTLVPNAIPTH